MSYVLQVWESPRPTSLEDADDIPGRLPADKGVRPRPASSDQFWIAPRLRTTTRRTSLLLLVLSRVLVATMALAANAAVHAQDCSPAVYEAIGKRLHAPGLASGELVASAACKRDPGDPRVTLVAVAWNNGQQAHYRKAFVVAEVDENARNVLAMAERDVVADASTPFIGDDLSIDTAPYVLAPGVRAFGVDVHESVMRCADGGTEQGRTLYVREGRRLRPVLEHQPIRGGWIIDNSGCGDAEVRESYEVTIAVGPHGSHGLRDLVMTTRFERSDGKASTRKTEHLTNSYDGESYSSIDAPAPWELANGTPAPRP